LGHGVNIINKSYHSDEAQILTPGI